ncbi:hypothetical protein CK203_087081 [Vitis vinifera]|uniref:Cleavage/polyadenylation specificity factor A subunit N-terminal domain-containing protein n=1 Tax=Vitis vinifera TaxID=29760 RepID=A0A438EAN2_VITVI|nr:hypothetical protein CK203_087081 [Vitis vinifera]
MVKIIWMPLDVILNCALSLAVKRRSVRFRQDSSEGSACFVAFKGKEVGHLKSMMPPLIPVKAVSIQALSAKKFLILDSDGDVHLLCLSIYHLGSEITCHMRQFTNTMKVQKLAVLPDTSTRGRTVWISDGFYSVHMMTVSDTDTSANEDDENDSEEKLKQISVTQAIFASERIQDIIPLAANALLILGQGKLWFSPAKIILWNKGIMWKFFVWDANKNC